MKDNKEKDQQEEQGQDRMDYDVNDTSRTLKPGSVKGSTPGSPDSSSQKVGLAGANDNIIPKPGKGHGDSEDHAEAGSQNQKKRNDRGE